MVTSNIEEHYIKTPFIGVDKAKALKLKFISEFGNLSISKPEFISGPPPKIPRFTKDQEKQFFSNEPTNIQTLQKAANALKPPVPDEILSGLSKVKDPIKKEIYADALADVIKRNNAMANKPLNNVPFVEKLKEYFFGSTGVEKVLNSLDLTDEIDIRIRDFILEADEKLKSISARFGHAFYTQTLNFFRTSALFMMMQYSARPSGLVVALGVLLHFLDSIAHARDEEDANIELEKQKNKILSYNEIENLPPGELHDYVEGLLNGKQLTTELKNFALNADSFDDLKNYDKNDALNYLNNKQSDIIKQDPNYIWFSNLAETIIEDFEKENLNKTTSLSIASKKNESMETETEDQKMDEESIQNTPGSSFMEEPMKEPVNEKENNGIKALEEIKNFIYEVITAPERNKKAKKYVTPEERLYNFIAPRLYIRDKTGNNKNRPEKKFYDYIFNIKPEQAKIENPEQAKIENIEMKKKEDIYKNIRETIRRHKEEGAPIDWKSILSGFGWKNKEEIEAVEDKSYAVGDPVPNENLSTYITSLFTKFPHLIYDSLNTEAKLYAAGLIGAASYDFIRWIVKRKTIAALNAGNEQLQLLKFDRDYLYKSAKKKVISDWNSPNVISGLDEKIKNIKLVAPPLNFFTTKAAGISMLGAYFAALLEGNYSVFTTAIAKLYFICMNNLKNDQTNNKIIDSDIKLSSETNNIIYTEEEKAIIDKLTTKIGEFSEKIKDIDFKKKFLDNINNEKLNDVEKILQNSVIIPNTIISEQPLEITNVESGTIQALETLTATDLDREIDTMKQIKEQADINKEKIVQRYEAVERFAKKHDVSYEEGMAFLTQKINAFNSVEKNEKILLALEKNPDLIVYGNRQINYDNMMLETNKDISIRPIKNSLDVSKDLLDQVKTTGVISKAVITQITAQGLQSANGFLAYINTDLINLLNDQKSGKDIIIQDYPVLFKYFGKYKNPSEIVAVALKEVKEVEKLKNEITSIARDLFHLADVASNLLEYKNPGFSNVNQPTMTSLEKEKKIQGLLTNLFEKLSKLFNILMFFNIHQMQKQIKIKMVLSYCLLQIKMNKKK